MFCKPGECSQGKFFRRSGHIVLCDARGLSEHRRPGRAWHETSHVSIHAITRAGDFFLQEVEDFVNVSFFVKFMLLFWRPC